MWRVRLGQQRLHLMPPKVEINTGTPRCSFSPRNFRRENAPSKGGASSSYQTRSTSAHEPSLLLSKQLWSLLRWFLTHARVGYNIINIGGCKTRDVTCSNNGTEPGCASWQGSDPSSGSASTESCEVITIDDGRRTIMLHLILEQEFRFGLQWSIG